jgi:glycosyltransferase involved in cell wall biosynthesis
MRVLLLHNKYREPGGEDVVVRAEADLLRSHGVEVHTHEVDQEAASGVSLVRLGWQSAWSRDSAREIFQLCGELRPDIVHVHNFWMRLSPSVHRAARRAGAATVQTLHNFRLLCLNALLMRNGRVCEDCVGVAPWRGVVRRCYRGSFAASVGMAHMLAANRLRGTWHDDVDAFIALTEHSRAKFAEAGLPEEKILLKPNFCANPSQVPCPPSHSRAVLFAGRLSREKGAHILLEAWTSIPDHRRGTLLIAGDGPEREHLQTFCARLRLGSSDVRFLGRLEQGPLQQLISEVRAVVVPSICYETFGMIAVEAFARGRAVIASNIGALAEIVRDGQTGFCAPPGDVPGLAKALALMLVMDRLADSLGANARAAYLAEYTPQHNFARLMAIYRFASTRLSRTQHPPQEAREAVSRGAEHW